jgi:hypothetical protein
MFYYGWVDTMTTGTAVLPLIQTQSRTHLEAHIQAVVERSFHIVRERVVAALETQGRLPVVFWMQAHDFLVYALMPVFVEGVLLGIEEIHPYRALRGERLNHASIRGIARQIVCELAEEVTAAAGTLVTGMLVDNNGPGVAATGLLSQGPLSADCAFQIAMSEAQRLLAAGHILGRQAQPETGAILTGQLS